MKELTGTCLFCGQTQLVNAETQKQADQLATENCSCDNKLKKVRQCSDNIHTITGTEAQDIGMEPVTEKVVEQLQELGKLVVYGYIEAASIKLTDSTITLKAIKGATSVSRKKVLSAKLEA
ncbi:MAG: hypothetical protein IKE52_02505 [Mogibacterium sp.]|nr:hypothetical protein [Mogibacterium sp.]